MYPVEHNYVLSGADQPLPQFICSTECVPILYPFCCPQTIIQRGEVWLSIKPILYFPSPSSPKLPTFTFIEQTTQSTPTTNSNRALPHSSQIAGCIGQVATRGFLTICADWLLNFNHWELYQGSVGAAQVALPLPWSEKVPSNLPSWIILCLCSPEEWPFGLALGNESKNRNCSNKIGSQSHNYHEVSSWSSNLQLCENFCFGSISKTCDGKRWWVVWMVVFIP